MIVIHPDLSWFDGSDQPCRNNCTGKCRNTFRYCYITGSYAGTCSDIRRDTAYNGYEDCNDIIWLIIDDEMAGYIKRVMGSFEVTDETISRKNPQLT